MKISARNTTNSPVGLLFAHDIGSMKNNTEFENFNNMMDKLLKVPHSEIKAKLDAEKAARAKKRKSKKTSASGRAGNAKD